MSSSAVPMEPVSVPYERFGPTPDLDAVPAYKWWAVFNIVCCCLPLGLVAVFYAGEVEERLAKRDFEGAKSASKTAMIFNILCMVFGLAAYSYLIYYCVQLSKAIRSGSSLPPIFG